MLCYIPAHVPNKTSNIRPNSGLSGRDILRQGSNPAYRTNDDVCAEYRLFRQQIQGNLVVRISLAYIL